MSSPRKQETSLIVWHCSATKPDHNIGVADIDKWHRAKKWDGCGYHLVIKRDGKIEAGRPLMHAGAHVAGVNNKSVGICMVGGVGSNGKPETNFTDEQWESAFIVNTFLTRMFPTAEVLGHRDLSPDLNGDGQITANEWMKECPCFDAAKVFETLVKPDGEVFDVADIQELSADDADDLEDEIDEELGGHDDDEDEFSD